MAHIFIVGHGIKTIPWVEGIGFTKDVKDSCFGPGVRKNYTIHFVLDGNGWFNGNPVNKGQGFLVYDNAVAKHHCDPSSPWELLWITISGEGCEKLFNDFGADKKTGVFTYNSYEVVSEVLREIKNFNKIQMSSAKMLETFLRLYNRCAPKTDKEVEIQNYVNWAVNYINANLYKDVTVVELTSRLGISQPYLYACFWAC